MHVELTKVFYVESAHTTERGLHGHGYRIEIVVAGEVDPALGWLIDYGDIKRAFEPLHRQLDHGVLNDLPGIEDVRIPGLRAWIMRQLAPGLPLLRDVRVSINGPCAFLLNEYPPDPASGLPARLGFAIEAAQSLPHLPASHPCRRLHGHTYCLEAAAPDLATLRGPLRAVYDALDHRYLNETPGLESATSERLCEWLWNRLIVEVPDLIVVVVQETLSARCIYHGR